MKKNLTNILLILVFFIGLSLLLYPSFSDYWNSLHQSQAIASYSEAVAEIKTDDTNIMLEQAHEFNRNLAAKDNPWAMTDEERKVYNETLNISNTGIMGYIEIPAIGCSLPIYHGTDEAVLQIAVGHLAETSLPVGGESTHTVLSGHRGLPSAKLFTDLDKVVVGDRFLLQILDETLTYEVDQILIVLPHEVDALAIEEGMDLCTLVTCTPYGINSHRLLVRGHRVENEAEEKTVRVTADALQIEPTLVAVALAVPVLLILLVLLLFTTRRRK